MNTIACWAPEDRRDLFNETAVRRNLSAVIVEKDFWVCWTLLQLFSMPEFDKHLVFKGGTSLSKVYGVIQRFSEDIDLSLSEEFLGIEVEDPELLSANQRNKRLKRIVKSCETIIVNTALPNLRSRIGSILDETGEPWSLESHEEDPATLLYKYPSALPSVLPYIKSNVRLEFGSGVDPWPPTKHSITSFVAEEFASVFTIPTAIVTTLEIGRTFWEKATIVHMANTRANPTASERISRHYYDLAHVYSRAELCDLHLDISLLKRVANHKRNYFSTSGVNYDDCYGGRLVLTPPADRVPALRDDYNAMGAMFMGEAMPFSEILDRLKDLERAVNAAAINLRLD